MTEIIYQNFGTNLAVGGVLGGNGTHSHALVLATAICSGASPWRIITATAPTPTFLQGLASTLNTSGSLANSNMFTYRIAIYNSADPLLVEEHARVILFTPTAGGVMAHVVNTKFASTFATSVAGWHVWSFGSTEGTVLTNTTSGSVHLIANTSTGFSSSTEMRIYVQIREDSLVVFGRSVDTGEILRACVISFLFGPHAPQTISAGMMMFNKSSITQVFSPVGPTYSQGNVFTPLITTLFNNISDTGQMFLRPVAFFRLTQPMITPFLKGVFFGPSSLVQNTFVDLGGVLYYCIGQFTDYSVLVTASPTAITA